MRNSVKYDHGASVRNHLNTKVCPRRCPQKTQPSAIRCQKPRKELRSKKTTQTAFMFLLNQTKGWRKGETLNNIFQTNVVQHICHIAGRAKGWEEPGVGNLQQKQRAAMALKKEGGWAGQDPALFSANPRPWHLLVTQKGHVLVFGAEVSHALYYLAWRTFAPSSDISCDIFYRALTRIRIFCIKLKLLDL